MKIKIQRTRDNKKRNFIFTSYYEYLWSSTPRELFFDWIIPMIISFLTVTSMYFLSSSNTDIFLNIKKINETSINVIAILAGFNTASLSIVGSINRGLLSEISSEKNTALEELLNSNSKKKPIFSRFKNLIMNNKKSNTLKITLNFFSYAVISQLIILIIGLVTSMLFAFLPNITLYINVSTSISKFIISLYGMALLTLILHTIFVSIRNVEMIYHFILYRNK